jgi:transcriptional regulator with XRE-family HTH domain
VGHRLRTLRERRGWSRGELAERLGVHAGSIARWETGGAVPHPYTLERIAELTGGTVAWMLTGAAEDESPPAAHPEAEDVFAMSDAMTRFVESIGPPGQERLRKLDALEGLRRMLTARGLLPGWWYALRERVEGGEV